MGGLQLNAHTLFLTSGIINNTPWTDWGPRWGFGAPDPGKQSPWGPFARGCANQVLAARGSIWTIPRAGLALCRGTYPRGGALAPWDLRYTERERYPGPSRGAGFKPPRDRKEPLQRRSPLKVYTPQSRHLDCRVVITKKKKRRGRRSSLEEASGYPLTRTHTSKKVHGGFRA